MVRLQVPLSGARIRSLSNKVFFIGIVSGNKRDTEKTHIDTGLITAIILLSSCNSQKNASETVFTASISPIKYLVEYITCGDFR